MTRPRPRWSGEFLIVAALLVGYDWVAATARVRTDLALDRAHWLLALEGSLHVAVEHSMDAALAAHARLGQLASLYYDFAHVLVTVAVLVGVYVLRPERYRRARNALVATNLVGLVVYLLLPVAPPRLLASPAFIDVVSRSHTWGSWEGASVAAAHANEYASMPSLHAAWALWVAYVVLSSVRRRPLRLLAGAHVLATVAVVLATGNHYVLDVVAGLAVTAAAWALLQDRTAAAVLERLPTARPGVLVVTASMGAGHDGVAYEMARRWEAAGTSAVVVDFLDLLPLRIGPALRWTYGVQLDKAPATYEWLYDVIERRPALDRVAGRVAGLACWRLMRLVRSGSPRLVLATYPLAGRALGQLRRSGRLQVPAVTFLTDVDVHQTWLDRGTDLYLAVYEGSARSARRRTGRPAVACGPVLPPHHSRPVSPEERQQARVALELTGQTAPVVLMVTGSWGVGEVLHSAEAIRKGGAVPLVLCGRNTQLAAELRSVGIRAVGWTDDVRSLYAASDVVVHNAGGLSSLEAMAAGVPVIGHACLPGHGRRNARAMADAGVAALATDTDELVSLIDQVAGSAAGRAMTDRALALFASDAVQDLQNVAPVPQLPAPGSRRALRLAAAFVALPLAFTVTSFGVSEASERGFGVARAPGADLNSVFVGVLLNDTAIDDPATPHTLQTAGVSAVVAVDAAVQHPTGVRALSQRGVSVLGQFPDLPHRPGPAMGACSRARHEIARAAASPVPSLVALHGLGAWSLTAAYRAHLPVGVARPVRAPADFVTRAGEQVVLDVPADQVDATLAAVLREAHAAGLTVRPLGSLWPTR